MLSHAEILERRKIARTKADPAEPTPWGWRRRIATGPDYEVLVELLVAGARKGVQRARRGQQTLFVLAGVLWFKDVASGVVTRLGPGQSVTTGAGREHELATASQEAEVLVIQSAGFESTLERAAGTGNALDPKRRSKRTPATEARARRPQGSFEERSARANGAQGLGRVQPLPGQPRTAADVAFGFGGTGVNLAPVVPEP